jgi:hypothetical protein
VQNHLLWRSKIPPRSEIGKGGERGPNPFVPSPAPIEEDSAEADDLVESEAIVEVAPVRARTCHMGMTRPASSWLDLIGVGLIDHTWPSHFDGELTARRQKLLAAPEG